MKQTPGKQNWMKWRKISALTMLMGVLILSHQNCAPATMMTGTPGLSGSGDISGGSPVSIIDNNKAGMELSFSTSSLQASSSSSVISIQGNCSLTQDGAVLGWKLDDASGNQIASGLAPCSEGQFSVNVESAQSLQCGSIYQVVAQLGAGDPAQIAIVRGCN